MKKVTLKDLNGKIIESYFASDNLKNFPTDMENHTVEDVPSNKDWFCMAGGQDNDSDHPLNKHDEGQMYNIVDDAGVDIETGKYVADVSAISALTESLLNKVKFQEFGSQIKIDDTIPSDFVDTGDLHLGSIYLVAGLGLTAKFVAQIIISKNKTLLQMKRHGTLFYVEEGQLLKVTEREVDNYLNEPF